jgi:hypothetical protein
MNRLTIPDPPGYVAFSLGENPPKSEALRDAIARSGGDFDSDTGRGNAEILRQIDPAFVGEFVAWLQASKIRRAEEDNAFVSRVFATIAERGEAFVRNHCPFSVRALTSVLSAAPESVFEMSYTGTGFRRLVLRRDA